MSPLEEEKPGLGFEGTKYTGEAEKGRPGGRTGLGTWGHMGAVAATGLSVPCGWGGGFHLSGPRNQDPAGPPV